MAPIAVKTAELIERVLDAYNVAPIALHDIRTGRVNKHWQAVTSAGAYVLRRYNELRTLDAIQYEHAVLRHLLDHGWPVAVPMPTETGETSVCRDGRHFSLFPRLPGRPGRPSVRQALLRGRLLARLHADLSSWQAPGQRVGFGRLWELDVFVSAQPHFRTFNELLMAFGQEYPELARALRVQKYASLRELSALGYGELPTVVGHFDFHSDNLLFQHGQLTGLLDLDLTHLDARAADIAENIRIGCLAPPAYDSIDVAAASAFVAGYTEHAPLREDELQLIVPLIRASILWLAAWRLIRWANGDREGAPRSIERSVSKRFPSLAAHRDELEAAILQTASGANQ